MEKIPLAVEAIRQVDSPSVGPYIESVRRTACERCARRNVDGTCDLRLTGHCMLDTYLPLVVEVIEEHFGAKQALRPPPLDAGPQACSNPALLESQDTGS